MATQNIIKTQSGREILRQNNGADIVSRQMFGKFFYEGDLTILFGDSNTGKSILANEVAFFVSGGGHGWMDMESPNIPSLYIDMEMSTRQFAKRYNNIGDYMPELYQRAEVNAMSYPEEKILPAIKASIIMQQDKPNGAKFIIIDNITNGFGSIYSASRMRKIISELKLLKERFELTILLIAHCPKRKPWTPITQDSLGGSKMLINFVDSAFAIAPSRQAEDIKYIKQIKSREDAKYSSVMSVKITDSPYLGFSFLGWDEEDNHLSENGILSVYEVITPEMEIEIIKMIQEDRSFSEISSTLGVSKSIIVDYALQNNL